MTSTGIQTVSSLRSETETPQKFNLFTKIGDLLGRRVKQIPNPSNLPGDGVKSGNRDTDGFVYLLLVPIALILSIAAIAEVVFTAGQSTVIFTFIGKILTRNNH